MSETNFDCHPQFFTATILEWKHLLKEDAFKDIVINRLRFFKKERSIVIYGFVDHAKSHPLNMANTGWF